MRVSLQLHPDSQCRALTGIDVDVEQAASGRLVLAYRAHGAIAAVRWPPKQVSARSDGLWKHTCFEAFVRGTGAAYGEYNFAPSLAWAAYRFSNYRADMNPAAVEPPRLDLETGADWLQLRADMALAPDARRLALCAVIEEMDGAKSYWALAHAPGKPDFHHALAFGYELSV